jgi:hypothetical protein
MLGTVDGVAHSGISFTIFDASASGSSKMREILEIYCG